MILLQVNADIKMFVTGSDEVPQLRILDTDSIGRTISTKAVGTQQREDITHLVRVFHIALLLNEITKLLSCSQGLDCTYHNREGT